MAVTIKKVSAKSVLDSVGLTPSSFPPGTRVQVIAKTGPWKYVCKTGDVGIVEKCAKANSAPNKPSPDDLYFVRLDKLQGKVVYLTFKELAVV